MDDPRKGTNYGEAILAAYEYLLATYPKVFTLGQGLWSPWYVGNSMTNLDKKFGQARVIDTPISELSTTGMAIGASLLGYRPIIVYPRMDFMILAMDQIVNQAAKWRHMLGGQSHAPVTFRSIINRGGEQGAQHSQALHAWFAHVPGLRVVMPYTVQDARDLLIAAVLCDDPVMYIDDRWLYGNVIDALPPVTELRLVDQRPEVRRVGKDVTLVAASFSVHLAMQAAAALEPEGIACEVIDLRVINPLDVAPVVASVAKTGRLCAIDGGWRTCGLAGEVIAAVVERLPVSVLQAPPRRLTLPDAPAPSSKPLEELYYTTVAQVAQTARELCAMRRVG
ncbi:MAG: alpha-ketoacid dehydrogenase subunit beta [Magnetococcales bacterium]|nr:alpha-ketoacid dehydrogenase subunit beta [Magnetococcales bacterium]